MKRHRGDDGLELEVPPFVPLPLDPMKRKAVSLIQMFHGPEAEKSSYSEVDGVPHVNLTQEKIERARFFQQCSCESDDVSLHLVLTNPPAVRIQKQELIRLPVGDTSEIVGLDIKDKGLLRAAGLAILSLEANGFEVGVAEETEGEIRLPAKRPVSPVKPETINLSRLAFYFLSVKDLETRVAFKISPETILLTLRRVQFVV